MSDKYLSIFDIIYNFFLNNLNLMILGILEVFICLLKKKKREEKDKDILILKGL